LKKNSAMADTFMVNLSKPLKSAQVVRDASCVERGATSDEGQETKNQIKDLQKQKAEFSQVCQTLNSVVNKMSQFYDEMLTKHREEIAKLSVEIANKVLMQKVQKGDYQIESIINEALKNAPTCQEVVVHLNPEDLTQYQKLQQDDPSGTLTGIKFVADPAIGRAECLLETPKGIVKSFVEQHLEQISEALSKVE
jgi:flagellar biosynthesis/type III secretory pathway protein FliH